MTPVFQLQDLPADVLFHIVAFLDIRDIVSLRNVCKTPACIVYLIELTFRSPSLSDL